MEITSYLLGKKSSGGGGSTTSLEPVNKSLNDYLSYLDTISENYETLSDTPTTLYTPNSNYKKYCIQKNSAGSYRILWYDDKMFYSESFGGIYSLSFAYNSSTKEIVPYSEIRNYYRSSNTYSNINQALNAIKSNTTTYSVQSSYYAIFQTEHDKCSNTVLIDEDENIIQGYKRISSKEIIEVI